MTFLLMLAGFNLASFSFAKPTRDIVLDMLKMVSKVVIPTVLILIAYGLVYQHFVWKELLMISFLLDHSHGNPFTKVPLWYVQVLLQMTLMISVVFMTINVSEYFNKYPILSTMTLLAIALLINVVDARPHPWQRLPHLYLWNFALGWALWALLAEPTRLNKIRASILVIVVAGVVFILPQEQFPILIYRFCVFAGLALAFIWVTQFRLPSLPAACINMVARATFWIFLFHLSFMKLYNFLWQDPNVEIIDLVLRFSFSLTMPVVLWLVYTASSRAYNQYKTLSKRPSLAYRKLPGQRAGRPVTDKHSKKNPLPSNSAS